VQLKRNRIITDNVSKALKSQYVMDSKEQNPSSESDNHLSGQEISHLLRNSGVHYHVHKNVTRPYTEPSESSPHPHTLFL